MPKWENVSQDELAENIAIGMHTGLRKGSDAPSSGPLWRAINESTDSAWSDAAGFVAYCFESMGWRVQRKVES